MIKTLLASAAITTLIAGQAFAAPGVESFPGSSGPGQSTNASSNWLIQGTAAAYCVLGKAGAGQGNSGSNVSIDTSQTNNGDAGVITINALQTPDDHANGWTANIQLPSSICNSPYTVSVQSIGGGLTTNTPSTNGSFTNKLAYTVGVTFGSGHNNSASADASNLTGHPTRLLSSDTATVGTFALSLSGQADSTHYLLAGKYADNLLVTMSPNLGG